MRSSKISSVKYIGKKETFNLKMAGEDHNFLLANKIVSGNSHSFSYSFLTYQTAWLKAYYPLEYYTALMCFHSDELDKLSIYIDNARKIYGFNIIPPDINLSEDEFTISKKHNSILFSLDALKGIGVKTVREIIKERKNGQFKNLEELYFRLRDKANITTGHLEILAKVGALNSIEPNRAVCLAMIQSLNEFEAETERYKSKLGTYEKRVIAYEEREKERKATIKNKKPALKKPEKPEKPKLVRPMNLVDFSDSAKGQMEKEILGFYITAHPLSRAPLTEWNIQLIKEISGDEEQLIKLVAMVKSIKKTKTKKDNKQMAIFTLEDLTGTLETPVFPKIYLRDGYKVQEGSIIKITIKTSYSQQYGTGYLAEDITILGEIDEPDHITFSLTKSANANILAKMVAEISPLLNSKGKVPILPNLSLDNIYISFDNRFMRTDTPNDVIKILRKYPVVIVT